MDTLPKEELTKTEYAAWQTSPHTQILLSRCLRLEQERDQYKQIAELNHDTIKRIQGEREPPHCSTCECVVQKWSDVFDKGAIL